jgi:hypothetical protein
MIQMKPSTATTQATDKKIKARTAMPLDVYQTADLSLSAFLQARGHEIKDIKSESRRGIFVFANSAQLREDLLRWGNDEPVSISVREFVNGMRDLKGLVGV